MRSIEAGFGDGWRFRPHLRRARVLVFGTLPLIAAVCIGALWLEIAQAQGGVPGGRIFSVAGISPGVDTQWPGPTDEEGLATATFLDSVSGVSVAGDGSFLISSGNRVMRVTRDGHLVVAAGVAQPGPAASLGDGGPATSAVLSSASGVAALPDGGFLIADYGHLAVRRVWPDGHISTVAGGTTGGGVGAGGPAAAALLGYPSAVAPLPDGGFLVAVSSQNAAVQRVWPDGHVSTVAGGGSALGDGGPATAARLSDPSAVAVLPDGGFLITDTNDNRVRRVWPDGRISTVAGNGKAGFSGDGGPATTASLKEPQGITALSDGGFLVADSGNERVRRVWPDGRISTVAGNKSGLLADGDPATAGPIAAGSLAVLPDGSVLIGAGYAVRLLVGSGGTSQLAAAIRPLAGAAITGGYRAHISLTMPAQVTARVYRGTRGGPIATATAAAAAGASTIGVSRRQALPPGVYAVDLRADAGSGATRTAEWLYLGGRLTTQFIRHLLERSAVAGAARDAASFGQPGATVAGEMLLPQQCHRFGPARIDCSWALDYAGAKCDKVSAQVLTPAGQIYSRDYACQVRRGAALFKRYPRWRSKRTLEDLSLAWG